MPKLVCYQQGNQGTEQQQQRQKPRHITGPQNDPFNKIQTMTTLVDVPT